MGQGGGREGTGSGEQGGGSYVSGEQGGGSYVSGEQGWDREGAAM